MKIVSLTAENVKRLVAVEIIPHSNVVQITGKNEAGKSSILDCIWWALAGAKNIQSVPIRDGEESARITLDLGDIVVTRTFKLHDDGHNFTTGLSVTSPEGAKFDSPQRMIDDFLGALSFDALEFERMRPIDQIATLRRLIPNYDFAAHDRNHNALFTERTDANREAKRLRAAASAIPIPPSAPADEIDEKEIVSELSGAATHNAACREASDNVARNKATLSYLHDERAKAVAFIAEVDGKIAKLQSDTESLQASLVPPRNIDELASRLESAKAHNAAVAKRRERDSLVSKAVELEERSSKITLALSDLKRAEAEAVAAASLPIGGLAIGESGILLDNLPFEQASDARRLRASVGIAMAMNPQLRVIRIRDGSRLDSDGMRLLESMADANDYQVWIERVADGPGMGFYIADGRLASAD